MEQTRGHCGKAGSDDKIQRSNKMTTKEVAQTCGVSIPTVTENAKKVGITLENGKAHEWTEEELKRVQVQLMKNTTSRGNATTLGKVVEGAALNALKGGLTIQELIHSGNVEAIKEFTQMAIEAAEQQNALIETQKQNQLLLEQKQAAEEETERIYQVNKNFHTNLYTASQIGTKLGITANMVGRIANEHNLKQDPIYGKLGKIQLNNGQWVNQFYYNDDALVVIKHFAFN